MAAPLPTGKQTVNLASGEVRVSRIRRDPPPPPKPEIYVDPEDRDRRDAIIGITLFALAIFVIVLAVGAYNGWSPSQYTFRM